MIKKFHSELGFNHQPSTIMHVDLNSCFATIEQQANQLLRGKPIAVAAFTTPNGCILAPSVEAKRFGIKTGMTVKEGKNLYPNLIVLPPDPWKYRNVHIKLRSLISRYTNDFEPKSIDEFVLDLKDYPCIRRRKQSLAIEYNGKQSLAIEYNGKQSLASEAGGMWDVGNEIKKRIKEEIGEWLTVSIGIAPNRYLAKIAAGLHKPDGLDEINIRNYLKVYAGLKLTDLTGIKDANALRLNSMGIFTVLQFWQSPLWKLKAAFESINSYYWYERLRGFEVDDVLFGRKSYGNSTSLGKNLSGVADLSPVLARLTEKMTARLRHAGYKAKGVHLALFYKDGSFWHEGRLTGGDLFDTRDFFRAALRLLMKADPKEPVRNIAVSCFGLTKDKTSQLGLFEDITKKENLIVASDTINTKWGDFTVGIARGFNGGKMILDRIAFGGVKELEEFTLQNY